MEIRLPLLDEFLDDWEAEHGALTSTELRQAATELALPQPVPTDPSP